MPPLLIARVPVVSESAMPKEEVAYPMNVLPGAPIKREDEAIDERPVPPPPTPKVPASVFAKVRVPPVLVMVVEAVRPLKGVEDVAKVRAPVKVVPGMARERSPVFEMVTFPVAPETPMPVPATFERTPVLLKAPAAYESPVPAVVVAA